MRVKKQVLAVLLFLSCINVAEFNVAALAQYPGDQFSNDFDSEISEDSNKTPPEMNIIENDNLPTSQINSNRSKDSIFVNFISIFQNRWPIFKERTSTLMIEIKKIFLTFLSDSQVRFLNNLSKLSKNTLFLSNFEIKGNSLVSSEQAINASGFNTGKWIWQINLDQSERALKQLAWVKSARTEVGIFPVSMKVVLEEYQPWMLAEFGRRLWIVSENGALLSPVAEVKDVETLRSLRSLPRLVGLNDNSKWADETYLKSENARYHHAVASIRFIEQAGGLPFRAGLIQLLPDGSLEISPAERAKQHPVVVLQVSNVDQAKERINILNKVLLDLDVKNELAKKIDLRFENRAVVS